MMKRRKKMTWKKLEESEYEAYFDTLSKALRDEKIEIEVMAPAVGDQQQTRWIPFIGISYDPPEKIISIISEYIDHRIKQPREVYVEDTDGGIASITISGGDGYEHLLKFNKPVSL